MAKATFSGTTVSYSVTVRNPHSGSTYIARCEGLVSSSTHSPEAAARSVAAKAFNRSGLFQEKVLPGAVKLSPIGSTVYVATHAEVSRGA